MTIFTRLGAAASILALTASATPLWAATMIKVAASGEGGGAMNIKLEPATVAAGPTIFEATNDAMGEDHEMIVVRLKSPDQEIPVNASKHRVDEAKLESLGEISDLKPGATGELQADLKAGAYLVFCNIKGHYEAGMAAKLIVTP